MDQNQSHARIAVDIGGTFTDVALETTSNGDRQFITAKTPTTPQDPVEGAITGVRLALNGSGIRPSEISSFIHGTTLATNALIEKKGAMVDRNRHLVLQAVHPSPLSASRGFFGNRHFSQANTYLRSHGKPAVNWQLPP